MLKRLIGILALALMLLPVSGALATDVPALDLNPPEWRGEEGTLYAQWFDWYKVTANKVPSPPMPVGEYWLYPDTWSVVGTLCPEAPYDFPYNDSHVSPPKGSTGFNAARLGGIGMTINLQGGGSFYLPNMEEVEPPQPYKYIHIQVKWTGDNLGTENDYLFFCADADGLQPYTQLYNYSTDYTPVGSENADMRIDVIGLMLTPNPCWEELFVHWYSPESTMKPSIDDIVIDTWCTDWAVPEPGTMLLAGFGVLVLLLSRRKR